MVKVAYTECLKFHHTGEGVLAMWDQFTSSYMIGWLLGLAAGMGIGISIGISIGKKQKPWSELTDSEKKSRIVAITAGVVLLVAGIAFLFIRLLAKSF